MEKPSTARIALKWGLILGIIACIIIAAVYMTGIWKGGALGLMLISFILPPIPYIIIHVLANNEYKRLNDNYLSFGEGIMIGLFIAIITSLIATSFNQVYISYIDTTIMQQMMDESRQMLEDMGLPDEQIEKQMEDSAKYQQKTGFSFILGVLMYGFLGFLLSLGITAATKNSKPEIDFN